jgi:hypothetical protein
LADVVPTLSSPPASHPIGVSGTLDLSAASDTLRLNFFLFVPFPAGPQSYLLGSYGTRLGEFDNVVGLMPGMSVMYTSPPNAGPGQIILQVPEPSAAVALVAVAALARRRRVSSRDGC